MNHVSELHSFTVPFQAHRSDMDQNGHTRTHAFLASAEDMRMRTPHLEQAQLPGAGPGRPLRRGPAEEPRIDRGQEG